MRTARFTFGCWSLNVPLRNRTCRVSTESGRGSRPEISAPDAELVGAVKCGATLGFASVRSYAVASTESAVKVKDGEVLQQHVVCPEGELRRQVAQRHIEFADATGDCLPKLHDPVGASIQRQVVV